MRFLLQPCGSVNGGQLELVQVKSGKFCMYFVPMFIASCSPIHTLFTSCISHRFGKGRMVECDYISNQSVLKCEYMEDITFPRVDTKFIDLQMFNWILRVSCARLVRYRVEHDKTKQFPED